MITSKQKKLIYATLEKMINNASSAVALKKLNNKHNAKLHFIPKRYRIFGGILQSLNIQFGNFIEEIIEDDDRYNILKDYSGKRSNNFVLSDYNDKIIDNYISKCQVEDLNLKVEFSKLQKEIIAHRNDKGQIFKHDIDFLFENKNTGIIYYLEMKYNDDHDSGKYVDINRKFIKTYAYLVREFDINNTNKLIPILFYFTNKKMKGNIYIPEETNIYRGKKFFDEFLDISYEDLDKYLHELSESRESINRFDDLYSYIVEGK